jgi:hypothetical protein
MSDLQTIVTAIQADVDAITGIRGAPSEPPDVIPVFPFAVCFPGSGTFEQETRGCMEGDHTIILEIHGARKNLRSDYLTIAPYGDTVAEKLLADEDLSGTVDVLQRMRYTFGPMEWNGLPTIGWRFEIDVHTKEPFTNGGS